MLCIIVLFLWFFSKNLVQSQNSTVNTIIPASEYYALQDFYNTTNGKQWSWKNTEEFGPKWFHGSEFPCNSPSWQGLHCNCTIYGYCHVIIILLHNYSLSGFLPRSIGDFTNLTSLILSDNKLRYSIPKELNSLTQLEHLNLRGNFLDGSLPPEIFDNKAQLYSLNLHGNGLTGTIPTSIGQLVAVNHVDISHNIFTGSLPSTIGSMTELIALDGSYNFFNGSLPSSFYQLEKLERCLLILNRITGSLGSELGQMHSLQDLQMGYNRLTGSLPSSIGNLTNLEYLIIFFNHLNGSLPIELYSLSNLSIISLYYNRISGSISPAIGNLTNLQGILMFGNKLTGSLPSTIGKLNNLINLQFYNNSLTGSIPNEICSCSMLSEVYMENNTFSNSIPSCLISGNVSVVELFGNQLTGSLPSVIGANMVSLLLYNNQLTGELPLKTALNLTFLDLSNNYFTSSIPLNAFNASILLQELVLSYNLLTGPLLPLGNLNKLQYFGVASNILSGSISSQYSRLQSITVFFINNNYFTGSIVYFDASNQPQVTNIDLSSNQITGTIPDEIFQLPHLATFAAVSNCITGTISEKFCNATKLTALALDGLHTASSCRVSLLPRISKSYALSYYTPGSIPSCLYNMDILTTLHASGNGILGSFPTDLVVGSAIDDLTLSHNQIYGKVPNSIGSNVFTRLDLSYNRLMGQLPSGPAPENMTLYYEVNRLSGPIPLVVKNVENINILNGNHFSCNANRDTIPVNDPEHNYYSCGTNTVEYTLYAWCTLFGIVVILIGSFIFGFKHKNSSKMLSIAREKYDSIKLWWSVYEKTNLKINDDIVKFGRFLNSLRYSLSIACLLLLILVIPCNVVLSAFYTTYESQYAWIVGSVYLSGLLPSLVLLFVFIIFISIIIGLLYRSLNIAYFTEESVKIGDIFDISKRNRRYCNYASLILIGLLNFGIILTANIIFVAIVIRYNDSIVTFTELVFALFKLLWNDLIIRNMTAYLHMWYITGWSLSSLEETYWQKLYVDFNLVSMLFNVLIIPCLATAFVSPDCIFNVIKAPDEVQSSFQFDTCVSYLPQVEVKLGTCKEFITFTSYTTYFPPYVYSYQCSATLITTYAVVYLYKFVFISFGQPLLILIESYAPSKLQSYFQPIIPRIYRSDVDIHEKKVVFTKERFVLRIAMYLSVLVTFGTIFPPLGITACVAIVIQAYLVQLNIGRLALKWIVNSDESEKLSVLNRDCSGVDGLFKQALPVLGPAAGLFYSFIIFDTYGNEVGGFRALPLAIAMIVIGIIIGVLFSSQSVQLQYRKRFVSHTSTTIELRASRIDQINPIHE